MEPKDEENAVDGEVTSTAKQNSPPAVSKWDNSLLLTLMAWAAVIGIVAAIALMLITLYQKKPGSNDEVIYQNGARKKTPDELSTASTSTSTDVPEPEINPSYAQSLFPTEFSSSTRTPSEPPPAVSEERIFSSAPMLKFMPLEVALGGGISSAVFNIQNDGNADLIFSLSTNTDLISTFPSSGVIKPSAHMPITVSGTSEGIVIIDSNGGHDLVIVLYKQ